LGGSLLVLEDTPPEWAEAVAASRSEGRAVFRDGAFVAAIGAGSEDLGALVLKTDRELVDADQRILERAALVCALLLLFRRASAEAEGRVRGELLDDLLAEPVRDPVTLRERARRLGIDLDTPHVLVVVRPSDPVPRNRVLSWAGT